MKLHDRKVIFHAVAEMFPLIEGTAFETFCEDIRKTGQREAILYVDGPDGEISIVDGRNRYRACVAVDRKPTFVKWDGKGSLAEAAASLNFFRRHLTSSQKAAAAVAIKRQFSIEASAASLSNLKRGRKAPDPAQMPGRGDARDQAARICDVSGRYIDMAEQVAEQSPAGFADLIAGKVTVSQAHRAVQRDAKRVKLASRKAPLMLGAGWEVKTGDSLKVLPTLPRKHFRLIIIDPPYNIGIDYGKGSRADQMPWHSYRRWASTMVDELAQVLTTDGQLWVVINNEWAADYVDLLKTAGLKMVSWIKWYETFGTNCSDNFNRTSRHLLRFARDPSRVVFNHDVFTSPSARQAKYADKRAAVRGKLWDDVWQIPRLVDNAAERIPDFPTQLPLGLIRPIVAGCSEPGDHVLDPCNGSGTTGHACVLEGRQYLGIEQNKQYAEWSRHRLTAAAEGSVAP